MKYILIFAFSLIQLAHAQLAYPPAKKITQTEVRFGTLIEDSYKWMENPSDPDLWNWIEEQKAVTDSYLDPNLIQAFADRTLEYRKIRNEQNRITGAALPLGVNQAAPLDDDLFTMGKSHKRLIKWKTSSHLKSNVFKNESSLYDIQLKTVASGDLNRVIVTNKTDNKVVDILLVKFYTFVAWADDSSFYYVSDLDERIGGGRPGLFKHTVGDIQSEDKLLLSGKSPSSNLVIHQLGTQFFAEVDDTIGTLQIATGKVTNKQLIDGEIVEISDSPQIEATVLSFKNSNNGEFYKLRLRDGQRTLFLKEQDFVLVKTSRLDALNTFILGLKDGANIAAIYDSQSVKLIGLNDGTIEFISYNNGVLKLSNETYSSPKKVYSYDLKAEELKTLASQSFPIEVESEKITYTASNGRPASMWVMKKAGLKLTPTTPTILYGYGGFRVSITPSFGIYESLSWIEKGGAFVVVTLPGSLDYGESWYQLARVGGRTHSFDSFALAAQELFKRGWTSPEHIGMMGASNGGTLTAGTLQRHSEIFKAAVPLVGVMDLINFTLFTAGKYWTNDYGNPFVEEDFKAIFPLSPYHNIQRRPYPATMVMTAEFDDRVVPMHSYKYLAKLQEYNTSNAPILLYNKEWGGHARASGSARESSRFVAAFYTFFSQQLGL